MGNVCAASVVDCDPSAKGGAVTVSGVGTNHRCLRHGRCLLYVPAQLRYALPRSQCVGAKFREDEPFPAFPVQVTVAFRKDPYFRELSSVFSATRSCSRMPGCHLLRW